MKTKLTTMLLLLLSLLALSIFVYMKLHPVREYHRLPRYTGSLDLPWHSPIHQPEKKTVVIMADNNMTEFFDLMAPFDLFSRTGQANVYVAAQYKRPITMENGPFILPHYTYSELDSTVVRPDVIVIPYMDSPESAWKTDWIRKHYNDSVILLSICDGAWTAAASGLYDGRPLTSHATGHENLRARFTGPDFIQHVSVAESGNLFSTGGVSNATDGSLAVIKKLFGEAVMLRVLQKIHYPYPDINPNHISSTVSTSVKMNALQKVLLGRNRSVGILMQNGMNELEMAALFDTYSRSLPSSIQAFTLTEQPIVTRHGLTVLADGILGSAIIDELHILNHQNIPQHLTYRLKKKNIITYDDQPGAYIIDRCLQHINKQYGAEFTLFVKRMLDYN